MSLTTRFLMRAEAADTAAVGCRTPLSWRQLHAGRGEGSGTGVMAAD